ncbi:hypothetical protein [Francisella philomiragia]|uniref:hypothetical protein n=1 Tax=Francisella philomiragia TaxID=28110 RepID=UPI001B8BF858|nr:hypothetical protein [Francisella philomiragia]QUE32400.1 hypothetical protein IMS64_09675 [Francisella philomiragia]
MNKEMMDEFKKWKFLGIKKVINSKDELDHIKINIQTTLFPNVKELVVYGTVEDFDGDLTKIKIVSRNKYTNIHKSFDDKEAMIIQDKDRLFELAENGELGFKIIDEFLKLAEINK